MALPAERIRTRLRGAAIDWEPYAFTPAPRLKKTGKIS
jgi:hypothetical protein